MRLKKILSFFVIALVLLFLIIKTDIATCTVIDALKLCVSAVIPTLFPFFVISGFLVNSGIVSAIGNILAPVSNFLFKTSGKGAVVFIIGIICGYPTGAKVIAEMYRNNNLDKKECERLLAFCNNSGPLFVIGAVGSAMLNNKSYGVILYIIHVASAILTGVFFRAFADKSDFVKRNDIVVSTIGGAVSKSIEQAVKSIFNVCGYVVFFALLSAMSKSIFITSFLEVTIGVKNIITLGLNTKAMLVLLSGILGFGGICVYFQVQSAVADTGLSTKMYLSGKALQSLIAMLISVIYINFFDTAIVFASFDKPLDTNYLWFAILLVCLLFTVSRLTKKT